MKNLIKVLLLVAFVQAVGSTASAQIMSIETRQEKLGVISALLGKKVVPVDVESLGLARQPFNPDQTSIVEQEETVVVEQHLTDAELLEELSQYVNPTGIFLFGGEFYLIFKERKMNVGTRFNIVYRGKEYTVSVSEITSSSYKIRYGETELQLKLK